MIGTPQFLFFSRLQRISIQIKFIHVYMYTVFSIICWLPVIGFTISNYSFVFIFLFIWQAKFNFEDDYILSWMPKFSWKGLHIEHLEIGDQEWTQRLESKRSFSSFNRSNHVSFHSVLWFHSYIIIYYVYLN